MDQDAFNMSIRKFLKMVGVSSQREIEQAVQKSADRLGNGFVVKMTLEIPALGVKVPFDGEIKLK
jgi:1,2-phenylacetyl-CoA epoxidase catalytic subunit